MTVITRHPGAGWDSSLPLMPKVALTLGFTTNHEYNASLLDQAQGTAVTAWADLRGDAPLLNAVGGVLRSEGASQFVEFSGSSGSLLATVPSGTVRTVIAVARVNVGDVMTGAGPIISTNLDGVVQGDVDDARPRNSETALLPAKRGKWHVYAYSVPATGNATLVVDGASAVFVPRGRDFTSVALGLGNSERRQVRVAHVFTSAEAVPPADLITAYGALKSYYSDLSW